MFYTEVGDLTVIIKSVMIISSSYIEILFLFEFSLIAFFLTFFYIIVDLKKMC